MLQEMPVMSSGGGGGLSLDDITGIENAQTITATAGNPLTIPTTQKAKAFIINSTSPYNVAWFGIDGEESNHPFTNNGNTIATGLTATYNNNNIVIGPQFSSGNNYTFICIAIY